MLEKWNKQDERTYEQAKKHARDSGAGEGRAREIAAKEVNEKRIREDRETDHPMGGSEDGGRPLEMQDKLELQRRANELNIEGREDMNCEQLIEAIRRRQ